MQLSFEMAANAAEIPSRCMSSSGFVSRRLPELLLHFHQSNNQSIITTIDLRLYNGPSTPNHPSHIYPT
jgi:BioD-like phosphotransacetylase family protein